MSRLFVPAVLSAQSPAEFAACETATSGGAVGADRPAWRALCGAAAVVVLFGAAGIALDVAWVPGLTSIDAEAVTLPAQVQIPVQAVRRCPHCGWIESKREILPGVADSLAPKVYEYTLRKTDGSSSVFQEALPVRWRLGEPLIFIDGADPLAATAAAGSQRN
jgi:hypothetical protein